MYISARINNYLTPEASYHLSNVTIHSLREETKKTKANSLEEVIGDELDSKEKTIDDLVKSLESLDECQDQRNQVEQDGA